MFIKLNTNLFKNQLFLKSFKTGGYRFVLVFVNNFELNHSSFDSIRLLYQIVPLHFCFNLGIIFFEILLRLGLAVWIAKFTEGSIFTHFSSENFSKMVGSRKVKFCILKRYITIATMTTLMDEIFFPCLIGGSVHILVCRYSQTTMSGVMAPTYGCLG